MPDLRYPVGPFQAETGLSRERCRELIAQIADAPQRLRSAVRGLSPSQLGTPDRSGGWTVRQVVHHLADSHLNWYIRTRLALTEQAPAVKPYAEARWAELADARDGPIEPSLLLVEGLHARWARLFESLAPEDWQRTLNHPERAVMTLESTLPMHAWHCRHHTSHITALRERMGW